MWVVLVVSLMNREHDHGRVHRLQKRLDEIPSGLHDLFYDILTRDTNNDDDSVRCIQWLLYSLRLLDPTELYCAIFASSGPQALLDWDPSVTTQSDIERFILSCSKGLAEVTKSTPPRVQFIHESVREFLTKTTTLRTIWPSSEHGFEGHSHEQLKTCCLNYLDDAVLDGAHFEVPLYELEIGVWSENWLQPRTYPSYPFILYALDGVLQHAEHAAMSGIDQQGFLLRFPLAKWASYRELCTRKSYHTDASLLYILAAWNLPTLASMCPSVLSYFKRERTKTLSPLSLALPRGHGKVVQAFVAAHARILAPGSVLRERCEQFSRCDSIQTECGPEWALRECLKFPSIIHHLITLGNELLLILALHAKARNLCSLNFNFASEEDGRTPLMLAVRLKRQMMVRILLQSRQVYVNARDRSGRTALMLAASDNSVVTASDLLTVGKANPLVKDHSGSMAITWAQDTGNNTMIQLLQAAESLANRQRTLRRTTTLQRITQTRECEVIEISDED